MTNFISRSCGDFTQVFPFCDIIRYYYLFKTSWIVFLIFHLLHNWLIIAVVSFVIKSFSWKLESMISLSFQWVLNISKENLILQRNKYGYKCYWFKMKLKIIFAFRWNSKIQNMDQTFSFLLGISLEKQNN